MLALSPPTPRHYSIDEDTTISKDDEGEMEIFDEFGDFSDSDLLIDFDDLFVGINDGDVLPDLEIIDPQLLADFSISTSDDSEVNTCDEKVEVNQRSNEEDGIWSKGEEITSRKDKEEKQRKSSSSSSSSSSTTTTTQSKSHLQGTGKRKVKVDWTPELHRRFVQAVEQLGVDKAVPSRILELMGIDCLTRHNIASHLQKYRSHRKHLLAREAEAATWTQKRNFYNATANGGVTKRNITPWATPTMGFPPITPMPPPYPHFRPLHVWGHPRIDQSILHMWPKHLANPSTPPHPSWPPGAPRPPLHDPSCWHHLPRVPNGMTSGTPCFLPPTATTRFITPPVPGIPPPHGMYKAEHRGIGQSLPHPLLDFHPSKESIDAAIGDVISKPWLPLPLGLKPPSMDGVLVELQRQGVPKIPPSCTA